MSDSGDPPGPGSEALPQADLLPLPLAPADGAAPALILPPPRMPPDVPELLKRGGPEAIEDYREAFARVFLRCPPLVDPQGRVNIFNGDACDHICYHNDRFDQRRKRAEREARLRDFWQQECAEHILWLLPALTAPSLIVHNNQVNGNLAYLLGFPTGNFGRPDRRYYASVRPLDKLMTKVRFKTAYPISQRQWDDAVRGRPGGGKHILYKGNSPRW